MAFERANWSRQSVALNTGEVTVDGDPVGGPAMFSYRSDDDAVATIAGANYFSNAVYDLSENDLIYIKGSDAVGMYVVSAINRTAGTISLTAASLTGAVNTANIVDGAVTNAKISDTAEIAFSKLADLDSAMLLVGSSTDVATKRAVTGDVTINNTGVTAIAAGAIVNADVNASAGIVFSKLEELTSGQIIVGSGANVPTARPLTGDATLTSGGALVLNPSLIRYAAVEMTAAEFNGAYAAPHLLVAAPGADELLVLEGAYVLMTYGSTQFANGGVAHIQYDDTANGAGVIASTTQAAANFFDAVSTALYFNPGVVKQPFSTAVTKGLYFSNVTGAFDTGNSDFVVHIWYRVIPV